MNSGLFVYLYVRRCVGPGARRKVAVVNICRYASAVTQGRSILETGRLTGSRRAGQETRDQKPDRVDGVEPRYLLVMVQALPSRSEWPGGCAKVSLGTVLL